MPAGTPPQKVLKGVKRLAREEFSHQHRYAMALHARRKGNTACTRTCTWWSKRSMNTAVQGSILARPICRGGGAVCRVSHGTRCRATATRREDRGFVKTHKKTPILSRRAPRTEEAGDLGAARDPEYGGGGFSLHAKEARGRQRELRTTGKVADRDAYRSLMNVRAQVNERYDEAVRWLRGQGREEEARRFELMRRNLRRCGPKSSSSPRSSSTAS